MIARRLIPVVLLASTALLAGCPLPASYNEQLSVPVFGTVAWDDGRPASRVGIAMSTDWSDRSCSKPAQQTRTDGAGQFALHRTEKHHDVIWLIPGFDVMPAGFHVCLQVRDTARAAYTGRALLKDSAATDTISCVAFAWHDTPRVSCNGQWQHDMVVGGEWASDSARDAGFYRLLTTQEPTQVKGYKKKYPQDRPYVYVQWVEPLSPNVAGGTTPTYVVRAIVSLPIDRNKIYEIHAMRLWQQERRWMVTLEGSEHEFMGVGRVALVFELGAPGNATLIDKEEF